jgi:hypothetical protein
LKHFCKLYERNRNQKIEKEKENRKKEEKARGKPFGLFPDPAHSPPGL